MYALSVLRLGQTLNLGFFSSKAAALVAMDKVNAHLATLPTVGNIVRLNEALNATFFLGDEQINVGFDVSPVAVIA